MPARVSLCTITRNRPKLLELLGDCILQQSYPLGLLEWVIVDDSDMGPVPSLVAVSDGGVRLKHLRLPGPLPIGAKRNLCHVHASADVLVLLDDDDYYPPSRVATAVAALEEGEALVAGCDRLPLLLLPEGSAWLTPAFGPGHATANTLAYTRAYLDAGHRFDPEATEAEEASFLDQFRTPLRQLDPLRTLTWIGHGANTVNKRLWIARIGEQRFERLDARSPGMPPSAFIEAYCRAAGLSSPAAPPAAEAEQPAPQLEQRWRIAVVTPYHQESLALIGRCHQSVLAQQVACTHVLVADGEGHPEIDGWNCRHIRLGAGHGDNGNTPRALGALAAMNEGFDCIAFLDADNWYAPDHLQQAITTQVASGCPVVFSDRHIVFPNGQRLTELPLEDRSRAHADTSCMVLFAPAFSCLALWAQMPRLLAPQCDRLIFAQLMASHRCEWSGATTVFFETWYANHFLAAGLLPPRNAKFLARHPAAAWKEAAEAFRQRSPTPIYPGADGIGPDKPRIQLVSILGPARSGGSWLQSRLCCHFHFFGIPEHQVLFQLVAHFGVDHQRRHDGSEVQQALAAPSPADPRVKAHDLRAQGIHRAINPQRSYTLLEAYFRVIQALTPPEGLTFSKAWGSAIVLERSCTQALVANVLFRCLPEHRALLMLRDPLEQIASVRRQQQRHPEAWQYAQQNGPSTLEQLAETTLQSLATPLAAAPPGQLKLVLFDQLAAEPSRVLEQVSGFLGMAPNPLLALEPQAGVPDGGLNPVHGQQWLKQMEDLPAQLLRDEPWKQDCMAGPPGQPLRRSAGLDPLTPDEQRSLAAVLAPVRQSLDWLQQRLVEPELDPPTFGPPKAGGASVLAALAADVAAGLVRHGQAEPR